MSGTLRAGSGPSRLRVDDHVDDLGVIAADALLDLARPRVGLGERPLRCQRQRQEGDEAAVR